MPSRYTDKGHRSNPWQAKVRAEGVEYHLGHYATKEEAEAAEDKFRATHGLKKPNRKAGK